MRKDELVRALVNHARRKQKSRRQRANQRRRMSDCRSLCTRSAPTNRRSSLKTEEQLHQLRERLSGSRQLAAVQRNESSRVENDRLVVMVRDPYWLHAYWELAPRSVERAQSALGPALAYDAARSSAVPLSNDGTAVLQREIVIHGGVNHWYVDVQNPPQQYRMEIGYLTASGQFYCLARSNAVTTPPAGTSDSVDENWVDIDENADRIFAMSGGYTQRGTSLELQELLEERLRRPMGTPMQTRYGSGAVALCRRFARSAVCGRCRTYWSTESAIRMPMSRCRASRCRFVPTAASPCGCSLPDRRQVIPVIASSPDGVEQRTIILAVERNTKVLEPGDARSGA